jgi:prepilin-type N-terminal cleavage/methylation domain-containing protein
VKKGFTLIELLIVIAILAILALGLLAALDPLEQLKRARDTATRNAVEEMYNATLRYYSVKGSFPWVSSAQSAVVLTAITGTYLQSLVDMGELKAKFQSESNLSKIYLTSVHADIDGNMDDIAVCFTPQSKSVRSEDDTKWNRAGGAGETGCPNPTMTSCYWCAR